MLCKAKMTIATAGTKTLVNGHSIRDEGAGTLACSKAEQTSED